MKILYGVQGTGNGHMSRARAMNRHFRKHDVEVDYLFSGRPESRYFDMDEFGNYRTCKGLTFHTENGRVSYPKTLIKNNPAVFFSDVRKLDTRGYDLILNDFEPVSAWAGKLQKKTVINIGHQPAFLHDIPRQGGNPVANAIMRLFAPGKVQIGLHWHHFEQPVLPPILHLDEIARQKGIEGKILVYLPFENQKTLANMLDAFSAFDFYIYAPGNDVIDNGHLHLRPLSVEGFRRDLYDCAGVICNSGFELPSECIQLGKRLLVKPVHQQMEQLSNALALEQLELGDTMHQLNEKQIEQWLYSKKRYAGRKYPDVAAALAEWIISGSKPDTFEQLKSRLWEQVELASYQSSPVS